jgi:hypothetical protein
MRKHLITPSPQAEVRGWRAADSGIQTVRLIFDQPQRLTAHRPRLRGSRNDAHPRVRFAMVWGWRALVSRNCASTIQLYPPNATREVEEYRVELSDVAVLELAIVPDIGRGSSRDPKEGEIVDTAIAFANTAGGRIYIGVADRDASPQGSDKVSLQLWGSIILEHLQPLICSRNTVRGYQNN